MNWGIFYFLDDTITIMELKIKLIIGLGNPDKKYENTYHNVGAWFAKYFKDFINSQQWIPSRLAILASALYVNESGKFVVRELKRTNTKPENLLIIHDDSDLVIGQYKFAQPGDGAAGHHGVESVKQYLIDNNLNDCRRLRIGIRPINENIRQKAGEFVLKKISAENKKILEKVFQEIIEKLKAKNPA